MEAAEWKRRGLINFHAAIRLRRAITRPGRPRTATKATTLAVLEAAIRAAVAHVDVSTTKPSPTLVVGRGS